MEDEYLKPDMEFIKEIKSSGGDTLKRCYQCATCSVTCPQAPENNPFPRKEMIWAQWGLKDRLIKDPDIWICHYCGDCTTHCPRGAKPGEVLNAIRQQSIAHYSTPGFLTNLVGKKSFLPALFGIPLIIFLAYIVFQGGFPDSDTIVYANLFPQIGFIDPLFIALAILVVASAGSGCLRMWKDMKKSFPPVRKKSIGGSIVSTLIAIFTHSKFNECVVNKDRFWAHFFTFYGFVLLAITTAIIAGLEWLSILHIVDMESIGIRETHLSNTYDIPVLGHIGESVTPLDSGVIGILFKLLANAGAVALIGGIGLVTLNRLKKEEKGAYFDWLLIITIMGVALSGIGSEIFRWVGISILAYPTYTIHLIFVFALFAYLPFSKLGHLFYRTVALIYLDYSGRNEPILVEEPAVEVEEAPEPEPEGEGGAEAAPAEEAPAEEAPPAEEGGAEPEAPAEEPKPESTAEEPKPEEE